MPSNDEQIEAAYQSAFDKEDIQKSWKDARKGEKLTDQEWQDLWKQAQVDAEMPLKMNAEGEKNLRRKRGLYGHEGAGAVAFELMEELADKAGAWVGQGVVSVSRPSKTILRSPARVGEETVYYPATYEVVYATTNWVVIEPEVVSNFAEIAERYNCRVYFRGNEGSKIDAVFRGRAGLNG